MEDPHDVPPRSRPALELTPDAGALTSIAPGRWQDLPLDVQQRIKAAMLDHKCITCITHDPDVSVWHQPRLDEYLVLLTCRNCHQTWEP